MVRADTIDLQDQDAPTAAEHNKQIEGDGIAPHQAAQFQQVQNERRSEEESLADAWNMAGQHGKEQEANGQSDAEAQKKADANGATNAEGDDGSEDEDDDDDTGSVKGIAGGGGVRKKLLKKGLDKKIKKMGEKGVVVGTGGVPNGKLPKVAGSGNKKTPSRASPAPSSGGGATGDSKRDRDEFEDDDEDMVHVKKRQKLTRVGSIASIASSNALGHDLERTESQDGSFVDDASVADD